MQIYVVQSGDSLWSIAGRFGVDPQQLIGVNQLPNPEQLVVGQAILIPSPDHLHLVQAGESLWSIARRYGKTVKELMEANQLTDTLIHPGQMLTIPEPEKPLKEVNAYLTRFDRSGVEAVQQASPHLTYLSVFEYAVREDGSLAGPDDTAVLQAARAAGVEPLLVLTNTTEGGFSSDLASSILNSEGVQDLLFDNLERVLREKGFRGVNIDFEFIYPEERELYNRFLQRIVERLRPQGYLITSALAPKTSETQQGLLYEAHDYPVHGQLMDFVVLMTYEWGYIAGPPMAVAPIGPVSRVLDYAVSVIPSSKIMMGVPTYGYDWPLPYQPGVTRATTITPQEALIRAVQNRAAIEFDGPSQSPFFYYFAPDGTEHVVWFEDPRSLQAKYDLVKRYNLRGVSLWTLNSTFPQNWPLLADNFRIR